VFVSHNQSQLFVILFRVETIILVAVFFLSTKVGANAIKLTLNLFISFFNNEHVSQNNLHFVYVGLSHRIHFFDKLLFYTL